jgi:hypothetical protein
VSVVLEMLAIVPRMRTLPAAPTSRIGCSEAVVAGAMAVVGVIFVVCAKTGTAMVAARTNADAMMAFLFIFIID